VPGVDARFTVTPYDYAAAERLSAALGVSHVLAQVLVRRGLGEEAEARAFLAAAEAHPLDAFGGLREAARQILGHVGRRSRITVHGDYDVDGVASTAVLVRALRTLGADVDWYLPSRIDDGYGLAAATVARLAERGTDLLVTVDCAITAVEEVAAARAAGMDVVVTDHHAPRADGRLPDAPIVHPLAGAYPCAELCATGVAFKLAQALLEAAGEDPAAADEDLDLVALATVADVVPLLGENRRLVREGLRALAGTRKPGLRALMAVARVDPGLLDATAIGFRLAPRINAAGRLHRADAGLELLLTEDAERARAIAAELDAVNTERRDVETRILFAAEAQVAEQGPAPAYVLAAEDWHPGVIGIVAARIAERHHRPTVLIALDGPEGTG
jgi:single-stranded-DNA-specific exonuclease